MFKLRFILYRWKFTQAGAGCGIGARVRILGRAKISLGDRVTLREGLTVGGNGSLEIGDRSTINENVIITATDRVSIGSDCMIAPYVYILDVDHEFERRDVLIRDSGYSSAPVCIGNDVWVGAQTVIVKGVTIGEGAVIGANSFVNRDIPDYCVAVGSPAKVIRSRFE